VVIVLGVICSVLLWAKPNDFIWATLLGGGLLAIVGFVDDYIKVRRIDVKGLSSRWKWAAQGLAAFIALYFLFGNPSVTMKFSEIWVPFVKHPLFVDVPFMVIFLFWFVVLAGTSNAINLTDGIDGLATGCTITVVMTYGIFAYISGNTVLCKYLHICYIPGSEELCILCGSIVGASLGFLWYNAHPAEIFMGDVGALTLGAWTGLIALMTQQAFTLVIVGLVFVLEALSVILQVTSFKIFGWRIFRMTPLHHHFELQNIPESKLIVRIWIVSLLCALAGLITLKLR
jgi:phospho-N-acetylmuramoyl-pentapeptide-transferase